jgi:LCP family protein required for cell wall assembly
MTRIQKNILTVLSIIASAMIVLVGWLGYQIYASYWRAPLGPAIAMPTSDWQLPATWTPTPLDSPPGLSSDLSTSLLPELNPTNTLAPTATPAEVSYCGGPQTMTLLAIGTDARSNSYTYGLADVIRIVRVDFATAKVTILEFPRDLWVEIPDIADDIHGQDHEKLNQAYLYGNPGFGYYDGPGEGPGLLARTLALNFGVHSDRYIAVNMRTFEKIVDAVGGIKVNLPNGIDGRTSKDRSARLVFPPGVQTLDGEQALTLARIRNEGVFERATHQNTVMCALQEKLTSPSVVLRIPALINAFKGAVQTDLTPEQITQLGCIGTKLTGADITFVSFPQELFESARIFDPVFDGRVFVWDVDYDVLRDYVTRFNAGTWPAPTIAGDSEPGEDSASTCP